MLPLAKKKTFPSAMRLSRCPGGTRGAGYRGRGGVSCSLERRLIQPHLPVRLPCYDFTPLAPHTFGASAPCGFGRRLRVQTTRVV